MGINPNECLVKDVMTKAVITIGPDATLHDVARILFENHISGMPVVDGSNRLLGMVSETDIVAAVKSYEKRLNMVFPAPTILSIDFRTEYKEKELAAAIAEFQSLQVKDIMTKEVYVLGPEDTLQRVILIMNSFGVNRIPVIKDMKLVGIVARADVIRFLGSTCPENPLAPSGERPKSGE